MPTPFESEARTAKILDLAAALDSLAAEQRFVEGNAALCCIVEAGNEDFWTLLAYRVTKARLERGDTRTCHTPSPETRAGLVAHLKARLSPLEAAEVALAKCGPSGSVEPDESPEFMRSEDRALLRGMQAALTSHDQTTWGN